MPRPAAVPWPSGSNPSLSVSARALASASASRVTWESVTPMTSDLPPARTMATDEFFPNDWRASTSIEALDPARRMPPMFLVLTNLAAIHITSSTTPIEMMSRPSRPTKEVVAAVIMGIVANFSDRNRLCRSVSEKNGGSTASLVGGGDDLGDADTELVVDHHHLAAGDEGAVDQEVDRAAGDPVQLDDRAGGEGQQVPHRHASAAQLGGDAHLHVGQQVQRLGVAQGIAAAGLGLVEVGQVHAAVSATGAGAGRGRLVVGDVDGHGEGAPQFVAGDQRHRD